MIFISDDFKPIYHRPFINNNARSYTNSHFISAGRDYDKKAFAGYSGSPSASFFLDSN